MIKDHLDDAIKTLAEIGKSTSPADAITLRHELERLARAVAQLTGQDFNTLHRAAEKAITS